MVRLRAILVAAALAGAAVAPLHAAPRGAGYPVLDAPDASRAYVSGQVTAIARNARGLLFVGSSRLAVFDGHHWQRIEVPGAQRITALAPDGDTRVWIGADGDVGWAERDPTGQWLFRSLWPQLQQAGFEDDGNTIIYSVFVRGAEVVLLGRTKVARWDGARFTVFEMPSPIRLYAYTAGSDLLIYQSGGGLFRWESDGPRLWLPQAGLPTNQPLTGYVTRADGSGLGLFYEELFAHRDGRWTRLDPVSNELRGRRALHAVLLHDRLLAIGTAFGGVVLADPDGRIRGLVNTQNGLPDDHIDSLIADAEGSLWIGMISGGLARWSGVESGAIFDQRARYTPGGLTRIFDWEGRARIVSWRRVYTVPEEKTGTPGRQIERLDHIWNRLLDAAPWAGRLWLGARDGLWSVTPEGRVEWQLAEGPVGGFIPAGGGLLYFQGDRIRWRQSQGSDFADRDLGRLPDGPVAQALEDTGGRIWVLGQSGRVHRLAQSETEAWRLEKFPEPAGAPSNISHLTRVGRLVCAIADGRAQVWDEAAGRFSALASAAKWRVVAATPLGDGAVWCVQDAASPDAPRALLRVTADPANPAGVICTPLQAPGLAQTGDISHLGVTATQGTTWLWAGGDGALLRLDAAALADAPPVPELELTQLSVEGARQVLPGAATARLPAGSNRIRVAFAAPQTAADGGGLRFQTRLPGRDEEWSQAQALPEWEFSALPAGEYTLLARAVDRFGRPGPEHRVAFAIAAPWFRTPGALALWAGLALALAWSAYRWRIGLLRGQAARLEQLVQERTRELSLSNTAKSEFLDNLAHEIRRPANGLAAVVRDLESGALTPAQREQARLLRLATGSLARVCDEVLAFSRVEAGAAIVEARPFNVRELLARVRAAAESPENISFDLPADFADGFLGDEAKLETIVSNFVANAHRHAPSAPVLIHAVHTEDGPGRGQLLIEVADGGPGVPAEEQETIFRRFARGSRATAEGVPGTGIGLALCRALARLLGGSVGVESPSEIARSRGWPGPGAAFFVRVPVARGDRPTPATG
jgi:signal transduction histidine kinase